MPGQCKPKISKWGHPNLHLRSIFNHQLPFLAPQSRPYGMRTPVPEIIDPVFAKTSPNPSFSMTEYERFWLVFTKTRVYKFGHRWLRRIKYSKFGLCLTQSRLWFRENVVLPCGSYYTKLDGLEYWRQNVKNLKGDQSEILDYTLISTTLEYH